MEFALDVASAERIAPRRDVQAVCPSCRAPVTPKMGAIVVHHWAHDSREDCDSWSEGETLWHRNWKSLFPPDSREVVLGPHRADVRLPSGTVVEFQTKALSPEEFAERETFYGPMVWVFNAEEPFREGRLRLHEDLYETYTEVHGVTHVALNTLFSWAFSWKSIWTAKRPKFLDIGDGRLLWVRAPSERSEQAGSAVIIDRATFVRHMDHTPGARSCFLNAPGPECRVVWMGGCL